MLWGRWWCDVIVWCRGVTTSETSGWLFMTGIREGLVIGDGGSLHRDELSQMFSLNCRWTDTSLLFPVFETLTGNFETDFWGDGAGLGRSGLSRRCFATGILLTLALIFGITFFESNFKLVFTRHVFVSISISYCKFFFSQSAWCNDVVLIHRFVPIGFRQITSDCQFPDFLFDRQIFTE